MEDIRLSTGESSYERPDCPIRAHRVSGEVTCGEKRPLLRLGKLLVAFISIGIAFRVAGYQGLLTSLAAIGAAATLPIGFALQNTLSNFVVGVFIYTDRPFRIGD